MLVELQYVSWSGTDRRPATIDRRQSMIVVLIGLVIRSDYIAYIQMINVEKKQIKTIEDYRHNIKLLKYHLKQEAKKNQKLKYQVARSKHHSKNSEDAGRHHHYSLNDTVKAVSERLRVMGLVMGDLFRMTDHQYEGEINKEDFMKTTARLRINLESSLFVEMFYEIDTSLNGLISEDEFMEFAIAYGGSTDSKQIRKFEKQVKSKLGNLIIKKYQSIEAFLNNFPDPIPVKDCEKEFKALGLSNNETMLMLKTFDPSHEGKIKHQLFAFLMQKVKFKSEKQQKEESEEKDIQELCAYWRDHKMNPIVVFEEADVDGIDGVTPFELEQAFKKLMPGETNFQIKKWVDMINLNKDNQITKEQFMNSIRSFYSLTQMSKFSDEYQKLHPELTPEHQEENIEEIMRQLSIKIEDSGMKKKEAFDFIDFNKNGQLSKEEMIEGFKRLGLEVNLIGRVMSVFDRDSSSEVSLEEWLKILGEDVEISDVPMPSDMDDQFESDQSLMKEETKGEKSAAAKTVKNTAMKPSASKVTQKMRKQPIESLNKKQKQNQEKEMRKGNQNQRNKENDVVKAVNGGSKSHENRSKLPESKQRPHESKEKPKPHESKIKPHESKPKFSESQTKHSQSKVKTQNRQFTEDMVHSTKKNSKVKEVQKPSKPIKTVKQEREPSVLSDDNIEEVTNIDQIQQRLARQYKQKPRRMLQIFKKKDTQNRGLIKMPQFYACLSEISSSISEEQKKQIFVKYCIDGSHIRYGQWLQQIAENYAGDVEEQEDEDEKGDNNEENQQKDQYENRSKNQQINDQPQMKKTQSVHEVQDKKNIDKKPKKWGNQIVPGLISSVSRKRGENVKGFDSLLSLTLKDSKKVDKGYKLIDYIDGDTNELKRARDQHLAKAQAIKKAGKVFKDKAFPPSKQSLISVSKNCQIQNLSLISWKHYSELFKKPELFVGSVQPNDIKQGGLGDCYFLSALTCLSEYNNVIERLFEYYDLQNGYFLIWLCIDGLWKLFEIDGYIPVGPDGKLAFSRTTNDELWVIILEKAYAKAYGEYNNIVGGQPYEAIKDLSGAPGRTYSHQKTSVDQLWQKLMEANQQQYMMTAGTPAELGQASKMQGRQEGVTSDGVVLGHAYAILDCQQAAGERLIQLRNPWGQTEWLGEWSDQSSKWTSELRKKLHYTGKQDDGIFWMPVQAFFQNFLTTSINVLRPDYFYQSYRQDHISQIAVKFDVSECSRGCIMTSQLDHRHKGLPPNTQYSLCHMVGFISQSGRVKQKVGDQRFLYEREGMISFDNLNKYPRGSSAVVLVNVEKSSHLVIGFYGDKKVDLSIENNCLQYLQQLALLEQNGPNSQEAAGMFRIWLTQVQGIGFLCFKNIHQQNINISVDIDQPDNVRVLHPHGKKNVLKMNPGETKSIKGKVLDQKQGFNFHQKISFERS